MAYIQITDSEIDPESPITTGLMARLRDNPIAMIDGAAGAPRVQTAAIADGAITTAKFGTITNIAVTSDPTTGNHLTRRSFADARYLRKDSGAGAQTVAGLVTFSDVVTNSAGISIGTGDIESRPDGTFPNAMVFNLVAFARGNTSSSTITVERGILNVGDATVSGNVLRIPMARAPGSGRTFLAMASGWGAAVGARYNAGSNRIELDGGGDGQAFELMVWEILL